MSIQGIYSAEQKLRSMLDRSDAPVEIFGSTITLQSDRKFGDVQAVQRYVDSVLSLNWVRSRWTQAWVPVRVRERRGAAKAHYEGWSAVIAVPPHEKGGSWAMREIVVLHEIAHHLSRGEYYSHGPKFVEAFTELVEEIMSSQAAFLLRALLHEEGVR